MVSNHGKLVGADHRKNRKYTPRCLRGVLISAPRHHGNYSHSFLFEGYLLRYFST